MDAVLAHRLAEALVRDRLSHFIVIAGWGEQPMQLITALARTLLCTERVDAANPCAVCPSCTTSLETHPDFCDVTIGERGTISVDAVRAVTKHAAFAALIGAWRIAVVRDADRLSTGAGNALLKVLEEPPEHFLCLMRVRSVRQLLPTIRSRAAVVRIPADSAVRVHVQPPTLPGVVQALELATNTEECERALRAWETILHHTLTSTGPTQETAVQWNAIERMRRQLRLHVNYKLALQTLLVSAHR